jgi:hypothetical protein
VTSQLGFHQLRKIILINLGEIDLELLEFEVADVAFPVDSLGKIA